MSLEKLLNLVPILPVRWLCDRSIQRISVRPVKAGKLPVRLLLFKRRYLRSARPLNCEVMLFDAVALFDKRFLDRSTHLSFLRPESVGMLPVKLLLLTRRRNRFVKLLKLDGMLPVKLLLSRRKRSRLPRFPR